MADADDLIAVTRGSQLVGSCAAVAVIHLELRSTRFGPGAEVHKGPLGVS